MTESKCAMPMQESVCQAIDAVEFFAGEGELGNACRRRGLRTVLYEIKMSEAAGRANAMDLTSPAGFLRDP